jgi:hypothetical protein
MFLYYRRAEPRRGSDRSDDDMVLISSGKRPSDANDMMSNSAEDSSNRDRRNTTNGGGGNLFWNIKRMFAPGITNVSNDRLYRTSTFCVSASVPTREVNHWVRMRCIDSCKIKLFQFRIVLN